MALNFRSFAKWSIAASLFFSITIASPTKAYVPVISELKSSFDEGVADTVTALTGAARLEAEKFLDTAFAQHINPTLKEIDRMVQSGISETDERVKARISQLDVIVRHVLSELKQGVEDIDTLRKNLVKDIRSLQGQIIDNAFCATDGLRAKAKADVDEVRKSFKPSILDYLSESGRRNIKCRNTLGLSKDPASWELARTYDLRKCVSLEEMNEKTPANTVASTYADLASLAATYRCAMRGVPDVADGKFTPEVIAMRKKYEAWVWALNITN